MLLLKSKQMIWQVLFLISLLFHSASVYSQSPHDPAIFGDGHCFNGTDYYIRVPNTALNNLSSGTVEMWVKFRTLSSPGFGEQFMLMRPKFTGSTYVGDLRLAKERAGGTNGDKFYFSLDNGVTRLYSMTVPIADKWYHVAGTWNGSQWKIFVDGNEENSISRSISLPNDPTMEVRLGKGLGVSLQYEAPFNGEMDEVRISKIARQSFDFCLIAPCDPAVDQNTMALWHLDESGATEIEDVSGNGNTGTVQGNQCTPPPANYEGNPDFGASHCFNGTDDYISITNNSSLDVSGRLTIEAWVKLDQLPSGNAHQTIVTKWIDPNINPGTGSGGWALIVNGSEGTGAGKLLLHIPGGYAFSNRVLTAGKWQHVAVTVGNGVASFFIDGLPAGGGAVGNGLNNTTSPLTIGMMSHHLYNANVAPYYFKGRIDEVRISSVVRAPYEFALSAPSHPVPKTLALWHLNDISGSNIDDASDRNNDGTSFGLGCSTISVKRVFPIQTLEQQSDIDNDGVFDLVSGRTTQVMIEFNDITGFTGQIANLQLDAYFMYSEIGTGWTRVTGASNVTATFEAGKFNSISAAGIETIEYKTSASESKKYLRLTFVPILLGSAIPLSSPIKIDLSRNGRAIQSFTTTTEWKLKATHGLSIAFYALPWTWINENQYSLADVQYTMRHNANLIRDLYPLSDNGLETSFEELKCPQGGCDLNWFTLTWEINRHFRRNHPQFKRFCAIGGIGWLDLPGFTGFLSAGGRAFPGLSTAILLSRYRHNVATGPHELGHTFGLPEAVVGCSFKPACEEYNECDPLPNGKRGCPSADGLLMRSKPFVESINETFINFMGADDDDYPGVNEATYTYLFKTLSNESFDPEIILVSGLTSQAHGGVIRWVDYLPAAVDIATDSGEYSVELVDKSGSTLFRRWFEQVRRIYGQSDSLDLDTTYFGLSLPLVGGTTEVLLKRGEVILDRIDPLVHLMKTNIYSLPHLANALNAADSLTTSTRDNAIAICNSLERLLALGRAEEANIALQHLRQLILASVPGDIPIDSLAIPVQVSKSETISQIDLINQKLNWYDQPCDTAHVVLSPANCYLTWVSDSTKMVSIYLGNLPSGIQVTEVLSQSLKINNALQVPDGSYQVLSGFDGFEGPVLQITLKAKNLLESLGQPLPEGEYFITVSGQLSSGSRLCSVARILLDSAPNASVAGAVTSQSAFLAGVAVDLFDFGDNLVASISTDQLGQFAFTGLERNQYSVSVIPPLGYSCNEPIKTVALITDSATVNFELTKLSITPQQRSRDYWAGQLTKVLQSKPASFTKAQFSRFAGLISQHFNDNMLNSVATYVVPQPANQNDSLVMMRKLLTFGCTEVNEPFLKKVAKGELVALMLNVAAGKVSQTHFVTQDGATLSQSITYCDMLINEVDCPIGDVPSWFMPGYPNRLEVLRYLKACFIGGLINVGVTLPSGQIPLDIMNIAYKESANPPIPTTYELSQNHPNPFNPTTTIRFAIPQTGNVQLEVLNIIGQRVCMLVDETRPAGTHQVQWDGRDNNGVAVSSGVYLYRIKAGEFTETKKMVLMK